MTKVRWSKNAIESLKNVLKYIAEDSLYYAKVFKERILAMVEHLE